MVMACCGAEVNVAVGRAGVNVAGGGVWLEVSVTGTITVTIGVWEPVIVVGWMITGVGVMMFGVELGGAVHTGKGCGATPQLSHAVRRMAKDKR